MGLARRHGRSLRSESSGVVYVEFLIAFMPLFTFFLGIVQLALIYPAQLVVEHAAYRGARTAIVILHDDRRFYDGDPPGNLGGTPLTTGDLKEGILRVALATGERVNTTLSRRATVELAAATVLAPLTAKSAGTIAGAFDRTTIDEAAEKTMGALVVEFYEDDVPNTDFDLDDMVTVRVEFEFECRVPVVRNLVCPGGTHTLEGEATLTAQGARYPNPY